MAKDTFWFPHDFEPTSDPKIQALIAEYGGIGYGIYWRLIEMIHSDNSHKIPLKQYIYIAIAKQMSANVKQNKCKIQQIEITPDCVKCLIDDCILIFELFYSDGSFFWSDRANRNLEKRAEISKTRSETGKKGAIAKQMQAIAKQTVAIDKQNQAKERIGEDRKGKEDINIAFDIFWNLYDKKVGDREKLKKKWELLKDDERQKAIQHIPRYKNSQPDKKFRKDPSTYLNNKSFEDEIIGENAEPSFKVLQPISNQPQKEYWEIHYGHLAKTKEEFMQLLADGKIEE